MVYNNEEKVEMLHIYGECGKKFGQSAAAVRGEIS
jgi:hypothetical protein